MKRMNLNEVNLVVSVISSKLNESKYEKIESKLKKDVEFKKLEKLIKERNELNKKVIELNRISNELNLKIRNKYNISNVYVDENNNIKISFSNNDYNKIKNEVILMNIGKDIDIEVMISKIIEKLS